VVDDLDDSGQTTGVGAVTLKEDDTANLDEAPVRCDNGSVTHFYGVLKIGRESALGVDAAENFGTG